MSFTARSTSDKPLTACVAYLGIGSNLGDKFANLQNCVSYLSQTDGIEIQRVSRIYETTPWGITEQPDFLNAAIEIKTFHAPQQLLNIIKDIETKMGREKSHRWGPRKIDIDILLYDNVTLKSEALTIPHINLHKRLFVIAPLCDLIADANLPEGNRSFKEIFQELTRLGEKVILNDKEIKL